MADTSAPTSAPEGEVSSNYTPKTYDIAPEDAALAESLVNQDPFRDLTGPATSNVSLKVPDVIPREWLSPSVRAQVEARLEEVPANGRTVQAEQAIMRDELKRYDYAVKVWGGPGPDANDYQQERFLIENEIYEAQSRLVERQSALAEIIRHDRKTHAETGEVYDEPVYRVRGDARSATEHEVSELRQRLALLQGPEGSRRLAKARWHAVENAKKLQAEADIDREAQALAKSEARAARVAERAAGYRKFEDTER